MKTFQQKTLLCKALQDLAPPGTEQNRAKKYPGFGILKGNDFRIAVHVGANGATVFTENKQILDFLAAKNIFSEECDPKKPYNKKRYRFPSLTITQIKDNEDSFRSLVQDSIKIKESGL